MNEIKHHKVNNWNKLKRGIWSIVHLVLVRPSPRIAHGWRRMLLRIFGAKIGRSCLIYPSARIWAPWNLEMSDGAVLGDEVNCYNVAPISLGPGSVVSQRTMLCSASHNYTDDHFELIAGDISIEEGAWVCTEGFIGPGVCIGSFAITAARCVVVKDISDYVIVAGNPAKLVATRPKTRYPPGFILSGILDRNNRN